MDNRVKYWMELSDYDFETARAMYTTGRWLYVGFMCHQTIEKIFKAYWCAKSTQTTPMSHNIINIAQSCGLNSILDEEQKMFISEIMPLNIEARYPSYKETLLRSLSKEKCEDILEKTNKLQQWTKDRL